MLLTGGDGHIVYNVFHLYVNRPPNLAKPPDITVVKSSCVQDNYM